MPTPKVKKIPQRMCVVCREMYPKSELLRIVRTPEGALEFDSAGKANGRGAYVCKKAECMEKCLKKRLLNKVFKTNIPDEVYRRLEEEHGDVQA